MAPTYLGDFALEGRTLREKGINRIGNLLVPNDNYCKFEDWIMPILDQMLKEQKETVVRDKITLISAKRTLKYGLLYFLLNLSRVYSGHHQK